VRHGRVHADRCQGLGLTLEAGEPAGPAHVEYSLAHELEACKIVSGAFGIDVLACPHCGGRLRLIATLHDPVVLRKILAHRALCPSGQSPGPTPPASGAAAF
jgi:hypothetical protein